MEKKKGQKRKKYHDALLNLYHPTPPPPPPPPLPRHPQIQFNDEELLRLVNQDINSNLDPEEESCASDTLDSEPKKLTRAQRKRIRKRKLKETASVRRKIIGPLFPSDYQDSTEEGFSDKIKPFQEGHGRLQGDAA